MPVNADKPLRWKQDIAESVDYYNTWFLEFAPQTFRDTRQVTTERVVMALQHTNNLADFSPEHLTKYPSVLQILRMATAPPLARDRLIGLAGVSTSLVTAMEKHNRIPPRMDSHELIGQLGRIVEVIVKLVDRDVFVWFDSDNRPEDSEIRRAATVVADRLTGAVANPIIRNAQEERQLRAIGNWLDARGYRHATATNKLQFDELESGEYAFRINVPVRQSGRDRPVNLPVDILVNPLQKAISDFPILIEAKSAGDFANTNKRRKEEAVKISQLQATYGHGIKYMLFLCGYFDSGYLGYEAAEGIDWVWEHRIDDFTEVGL